MQFCKITLYFLWLHYFQTIQYPRCRIILTDCTRSPQNPQLAVKRMHPTMDSWFGNPSLKYLWSQNVTSRQRGAVESCHTQWSVSTLPRTKRWETWTALYGSVRQKEVTSFANQVTNGQYHSDRWSFTAVRCIWVVMLEVEKEAFNSPVSNWHWNLAFHNLVRAT